MTLARETAEKLTSGLLRDLRVQVVCGTLGDEGASACKYLQSIEKAATTQEAVEAYLASADPELARPGMLVLTRDHWAGLTGARLESLLTRLAAKPSTDSAVLALVRILESYSEYRSGHYRASLRLVEQCVDPRAKDDFSAYVFVAAERVRGVAWQRLGDLMLAERHLSRSLSVSRSLGFAARLVCARDLASLKWAAGMTREALQMHLEPESREFARSVDAHGFLALSHLNAAKCAVDLKSLDLALEELLAAEAILNAHADDSRFDSYRGYAQLYAGELAVQQGNFPNGVDLIQAAQAWFEEMTPPRATAALDAKVSLAQVAFHAGEKRVAYDVIAKLLDEAEASGIWDARSRLLLLESFVLESDDLTMRKGFDDLVTRAHLINNPAVMLMTLGNLFSYAVKYLGDEEQAFVFKRIKNQRQFLTASCFDGLYRTYVTDRYAAALEQRLEEISGRSDLWFDMDEANDVADEDPDDEHRDAHDG